MSTNEDKKEITEKVKKTINSKVSMKSPVYMVVFYITSVSILLAMILQFVMIKYLGKHADLAGTLLGAGSLTNAVSADFQVPYDLLISGLTVYMILIGGTEGVRSITKTSANEGEGTISMPRYKRNRILAMLITYSILSIFATIFKIGTLGSPVAFYVSNFYFGVSTAMSLLAAADIGPKVTDDLIKKMMNKNI